MNYKYYIAALFFINSCSLTAMDGAELKYFKHCVAAIQENALRPLPNISALHALQNISDPDSKYYIENHTKNEFYSTFQDLNLTQLLTILEAHHQATDSPEQFKNIQLQLAKHNKSVIYTVQQISNDKNLKGQLDENNARDLGNTNQKRFSYMEAVKRSSSHKIQFNSQDLNKRNTTILLQNTKAYYSQNKHLLEKIDQPKQTNIHELTILESPTENNPEIEIQNPIPEKDSQLTTNPQPETFEPEQVPTESIQQPELSIPDAAEQKQVEQSANCAENQEPADEPQQPMIIEDSTLNNQILEEAGEPIGIYDHEATDMPNQAQQELVPQVTDEKKDQLPEQITTPELPQPTPSAIETPQALVTNEQQKQEPTPKSSSAEAMADKPDFAKASSDKQTEQPKPNHAPKHKEEKVAPTSFYKQLFLGLGGVGTILLILYCYNHCDKETLTHFFTGPQYALACLRGIVPGMAI